jgi:hypothetical protein
MDFETPFVGICKNSVCTASTTYVSVDRLVPGNSIVENACEECGEKLFIGDRTPKITEIQRRQLFARDPI